MRSGYSQWDQRSVRSVMHVLTGARGAIWHGIGTLTGNSTRTKQASTDVITSSNTPEKWMIPRFQKENPLQLNRALHRASLQFGVPDRAFWFRAPLGRHRQMVLARMALRIVKIFGKSCRGPGHGPGWCTCLPTPNHRWNNSISSAWNGV